MWTFQVLHLTAISLLGLCFYFKMPILTEVRCATHTSQMIVDFDTFSIDGEDVCVLWRSVTPRSQPDEVVFGLSAVLVCVNINICQTQYLKILLLFHKLPFQNFISCCVLKHFSLWQSNNFGFDSCCFCVIPKTGSSIKKVIKLFFSIFF